jgi:hypothetical protein
MLALRNARHERFAQEIAAGKSAAAAYRAAGYKADGRTAWQARTFWKRHFQHSIP